MKVLLSNLYPYLFLIFCFVIPLDKYATAIPNIVLIALLVSFPFVVKKEDFKRLVRLEFLLFGGLVVFITLEMLLFQDRLKDINIIAKIASSLLLVVLFIPIYSTKKLNKTIIISVLVCIAVSLFNLYGFYMKEGVFHFASGAAVDDVLIIDRLYLGFLCVLSIVASIGIIGSTYNEYNKWYFANIVLSIVFVLLISSRIAIILLLILFLLKIFYTKKKLEYGLFFIGIIAIVSGAFLVNKNLGERFFYTQSSDSGKSYIELFKSWEQRVVIWDCNYQILKNDTPVFTGNGFYETKNKLVACYDTTIERKEKRAYFLLKRFNPHNQFADFILSYGVIAFLLFTAIFISLLLKNRNSYYRTGLLLSIAAFAFIECFFQRQMGGYIFSMIFILIIFSGPEPSRQSTLENEEN
ncbi:O-antigen ligase family protein [Cochleicola gelatinilyticus]|uniref:O-antigen ligase-related domain-containing protein n=1 Tax=Cochleicola gelatinilyticus TaxID=1763537 RepID=A0A167J178_9FLAO|nr:O-antigen ligase family protein [Cochleicola gelatinilyticus]OAB80220.1 hypothetical protein ULVI_05655 [Cochleicola gelatinilyticus]